MRVLIIGEFSAFAKNLAKGINLLEGHEAIVFSNEDGFKKIMQDGKSFTYPCVQNVKIFGKSIKGTSFINGCKLYKQFKEDLKPFYHYFDIAFIISYTLLRRENNHCLPRFSIEDIKYAVKDSGKIFLSSCGGDMAFNKFALGDKRFMTVYTDKKILNNHSYIKLENKVKEIVDGVIPMSYQYHEAYRLYGDGFKLLDAIPLPFDYTTVPAKKTFYSKGKIVLFNGALRPTKGTKFINEAIEKICQKYPEKVELRNDRLPYDQFLAFLKQIDIYVDLCTDYDYGMSALAAMAAGCVVLSGNEPETRKCFQDDKIPVVSLTPDVNQIYDALERLITSPSEIEIIGRNSIKYVSEKHSCQLIAARYINVFQQ